MSAIIKSLETRMLTRDKLEQMLDAPTDEDALKFLYEAGYPEFRPDRPDEMDAALGTAREEIFSYLIDCAPEDRYFDIFRVKYDYHNLKALLKAKAVGQEPDSMLSEAGRVDLATLREAADGGDTNFLPTEFAEAFASAKEVFDTTGDPQLMDIVLDKFMFKEKLSMAAFTGSEFLGGYVELMIDAANLRAAVRTVRMGKNVDFLEGVLAESSGIAPADILTAVRGGGSGLAELYAPTLLSEAAQAGQAALDGDPLTEFERLCDDALCSYVADALYVAFGEEPLVGYLAALETEITNIRIIMMGRNAGISPDIIRSRLRATYV